MVCVPGLKASIQGLAGRYKADGLTETLVLQKFESADSLNDFIASKVHFFTGDGNSALIAFLCSVMLSRGLTKIKGNIHTIALVHLIPSWLIWAEVEYTVCMLFCPNDQ